MIDLTALKYFAAAYETGTFSQSARVNNVSQPTVSAAIQRLEDRLDTALFTRSKSGLTPTPLATRLYHDVVESVGHLSGLEARLRNTPQTRLRLHVAPDMMVGRIAPALQGLRRRDPTLVFTFCDTAEEADIAYLSEDCMPKGQAFIALEDEAFMIALHRLHPLALRNALTLADLTDQQIIHRPYCPRADRMDLGVLPTAPAAEVTNDAQLLDLVAAGLGIAFVPRGHGAGRDDLILLPLADADAGIRRTGLAHRKTDFATRIARDLAAVIAPQHRA